MEGDRPLGVIPGHMLLDLCRSMSPFVMQKAPQQQNVKKTCILEAGHVSRNQRQVRVTYRNTHDHSQRAEQSQPGGCASSRSHKLYHRLHQLNCCGHAPD